MEKFTITNRFTHLLFTENTYHKQSRTVKLLFHFIVILMLMHPNFLMAYFSFVLYDTNNSDIFVKSVQFHFKELLPLAGEIMFASKF